MLQVGATGINHQPTMEWTNVKEPMSVRLSSTYFKDIQDIPGGKVNILGGHSIGHSQQKIVYVHASYSERFSR
jgi:hypothetical protein